MTDLIDTLLTNPIAILIIALIVFAVLVWIFNKSKKDKWFKPIPLSSILKDQNIKLLKITRIRGYWGQLRRGDISLGKILKVGRVNYLTINPEYKKKKKKGDKKEKEKPQSKFIEREFYIVKVSFNPQIPLFVNILEAFNIGIKFAFIPTDYTKRYTLEAIGMKKNIDYININPQAQVFSFANVYTFGYHAFKLYKDISLFYQREKELEELVNYPKRIVYLDSVHAKKTESYEELDRIESQRFDRKIKGLTGER